MCVCMELIISAILTIFSCVKGCAMNIVFFDMVLQLTETLESIQQSAKTKITVSFFYMDFF